MAPFTLSTWAAWRLEQIRSSHTDDIKSLRGVALDAAGAMLAAGAVRADRDAALEAWLRKQPRQVAAMVLTTMAGLDLDGPEPERPPARFTLRPVPSILQAPDPTYLVDEWLTTGGLSMICGPYGSYKSFIAIDLALSIATGQAWHGHIVRPGPVLYAAGEGGPGVKRRVLAWCNPHSIDPLSVGDRFLLMSDSLHLIDAAQVDELLDLLAELPEPPALIILDTVARTMGGDENSSQDMSAFVQAADRIRAATGAAVLVVHHEGWGDTKRPRGSTVLPAALDTLMQTKADGPTLTIECTKQKDGEAPAKLYLARRVVEVGQDEDGRPVTSLVFTTTGAFDQLDSAQQSIYNVLVGLGGEVSTPDWLSAYHDAFPENHPERLEKTAFYAVVKLLISRKLVSSVRKGRTAWNKAFPDFRNRPDSFRRTMAPALSAFPAPLKGPNGGNAESSPEEDDQ